MKVYRLFTAYAMKSVLYDLTSKIYEIVFNPFAPEPPVTARADAGPFYPFGHHQF